MGRKRRDTLITFLRAGVVDNGLRREVGDFAPLHDTWADKSDVSDAERNAAAQVEAVITTRFVVRWTAGNATVVPSDLIRVGTQHYNITGIKEIGRRADLEISAHTVEGPA